MTKAKRARYTLEFKLEAIRMVESGETIAAAGRKLGMVRDANQKVASEFPAEYICFASAVSVSDDER